MRWSERTSFELAENRLAEVYRRARSWAGDELVDLTVSNPTRVGLVEPARLPALVGAAGAERYEPEAFGLASAREAVARYHAARGEPIDPAHVVLSASSSEAYTWIFKLLCDPGDRLLVPHPSYPLFDYLARLEGLEVRSFALARFDGFRVELGALEAALDERTRAIVLVSPNNPTGTFLRAYEARALFELAAKRGLAVIVDEVFRDALVEPPPRDERVSFASEPGALVFALGGLSKALCAPQLKLGWTRVLGPEALVREALHRLEIVADTYLSVATPVQLALPALLERAPLVQAELVARLRQNLAALDALLAQRADSPVRRLPVEGGWTVLLELPRFLDEDAWIERLAEEAHALFAPGWFFDLEGGGTLVASLIAEPSRFASAMARMLDTVDRACA
jgi:aspartate/methionine/tyrosine aminotransferase